MPQYLRLWIDHPKVGCGWRSYLVVREGRKWTRLLCTETAESLMLSEGEWAPIKNRSVQLPFKRTRVARRLREVAKTYGHADARVVKDALAMLR